VVLAEVFVVEVYLGLELFAGSRRLEEGLRCARTLSVVARPEHILSLS